MYFIDYQLHNRFSWLFLGVLIFLQSCIVGSPQDDRAGKDRNDPPFWASYRLLNHEGTCRMDWILGGDVLSEKKDLSDCRLYYELRSRPGEDYEILQSDTADFRNIHKIGNLFYGSFLFTADKSNKKQVLFLRCTERSSAYTHERIFSIKESEEKLTFGLRSTETGLFAQQKPAGSRLFFTSEKAKTIYVRRLKIDFLPALSPYSAGGRKSEQADLKGDSLFRIKPEKRFSLRDPALYFAQTDTLSKQGTTFRANEKGFPKILKINELIEAAEYIADNDEIFQMRKASDKKVALDRFWFALGGNTEKAGRMIRHYYRRAEYANLHFSSYKAGWKTDRGMVYMVFGLPHRMNQIEEGEEWEYENGGSNFVIKFTFIKKDINFSDNHYELIRSSRYKTPWLEAVRRMRSGADVY